MVVKISPKYQVVIPKEIRERLKLKPGQKVEFFEMDGAVYFQPYNRFEELAGVLKGRVNDFDREKEWVDEERRRLLGMD